MTAASPDRPSVRGFWSCARRASGRSHGGRPPFSASGGAMDLDMRGVDRHGSDHAGRPGQCVKNIGPDALAAPTIEAVVDRRVGTIIGRTIPPTRTRAQHVHDTTDDPAVVDAMRPAPAARHQRLNPSPLRIAQPIELLPHQGPPRFGSLESQLKPRWNPY